MAVPEQKQPCLVRLPAALLSEVRRIAEREGESQACVIRRFLRAGVEAARAEAEPR